MLNSGGIATEIAGALDVHGFFQQFLAFAFQVGHRVFFEEGEHQVFMGEQAGKEKVLIISDSWKEVYHLHISLALLFRIFVVQMEIFRVSLLFLRGFALRFPVFGADRF